MLDYDSWSIPEQIDSIYRATRININFYSRPYGRVTTAHQKWANFCWFALSALPVCSQFLQFLLQSQFSHTRRHSLKKNCCESTYQNLSSFQNLYQLFSYLENWACWTWFALNFLGMLSEHEIGTFSTFLMVKIWQILHLALFRPEAVVVACFTTSRARKAIDQATQSYFYFWPRSNRLASRGHRIQCT